MHKSANLVLAPGRSYYRDDSDMRGISKEQNTTHGC